MLLSITRHGENAALLDTLTRGQGRSKGMLPGATSRKNAAVLQIGNQLKLRWRARLADHLGNVTVELEQSRVAVLITSNLQLCALLTLCRLLVSFLPERHPYPRLYDATMCFLDDMAEVPDWPLSYLEWEMILLKEIGYQMNLDRCTVTGSTSDLVYVSPTTGRAVSRQGAGRWAPKLLPLVPCMLGLPPRDESEIITALNTTGYFLSKYLSLQSGRNVRLGERVRLMESATRLAEQDRLCT